MSLFGPKTKSQINSTKKRVTALKFGIAAALKRCYVELRRNGGGTATIADNRRNFYVFSKFEIYLQNNAGEGGLVLDRHPSTL